jgi:hypothetical protein
MSVGTTVYISDPMAGEHIQTIFFNVPTRWHFCTVFYSLQTALHVSGETFTHHQELE